MSESQPKTRTEATRPDATRHLHKKQAEALDVAADAEHVDGAEREKLTRKIQELAGKPKPTAD